MPLYLLVERRCIQIASSERIAYTVTDTKSDDPVGHQEPDNEQNQPHALKYAGRAFAAPCRCRFAAPSSSEAEALTPALFDTAGCDHSSATVQGAAADGVSGIAIVVGFGRFDG